LAFAQTSLNRKCLTLLFIHSDVIHKYLTSF